MATRPTSVQVGPVSFEVRWDSVAWAEAVEALGMDSGGFAVTDPKRGRITVSPSLSPSVARETFLHELLHACHLTAGVFPDDETSPETLVRAISPLLLDVLRRDPEVRDYLLEV